MSDSQKEVYFVTDTDDKINKRIMRLNRNMTKNYDLFEWRKHQKKQESGSEEEFVEELVGSPLEKELLIEERPRPTGTLIEDLCGSDRTLIGALENGLYEVPMQDFYPHLDFQEVAAFAASSWQARRKEPDYVSSYAEQTTYVLFTNFIASGIRWIRSRTFLKEGETTESRIQLYGRLNPYEGKRLKDRLERIEEEKVEDLRERLVQPVMIHVFEREYYREKRRRGGDNSMLRVMNFQQNAFPPTKRKGMYVFNKQWDTMVKSFAREIARKFRRYPVEYHPLE